jgi:hypothetical protein
LQRILLSRIARNTTNLSIFYGGFAAFRPRLYMVCGPFIPAAFLALTFQSHFTEPIIPSVDSEPLFVSKEPLIILKLYIWHGFEELS